MAVTREEIIEALKEMSLLEASELVKDIEETFGVSAADVAAVSAARQAIVELMGVFGIDVAAADASDEGAAYPDAVLALAAELAGYDGADKAAATQALLDARAAARKEKNWAVADAVRNGLSELGFVIEDTAQGARVTFNG